jgi:hypothetical protein
MGTEPILSVFIRKWKSDGNVDCQSQGCGLGSRGCRSQLHVCAAAGRVGRGDRPDRHRHQAGGRALLDSSGKIVQMVDLARPQWPLRACLSSHDYTLHALATCSEPGLCRCQVAGMLSSISCSAFSAMLAGKIPPPAFIRRDSRFDLAELSISPVSSICHCDISYAIDVFVVYRSEGLRGEGRLRVVGAMRGARRIASSREGSENGRWRVSGRRSAGLRGPGRAEQSVGQWTQKNMRRVTNW